MARKAFTLKVTASNGAVTEFFTVNKGQVKKIIASLGPTDSFKVHHVAY